MAWGPREHAGAGAAARAPPLPSRPVEAAATRAAPLRSRPIEEFSSVFVAAPDGLRLHVRRYGSRTASALPVVCLPGLARTAADFHDLAAALAADPAAPRLVVALDYRGHGRSQYDRNPGNYRLSVFLADVAAVLTALELAPAVFVGTSHGGLIAMLLAVERPTAIAGVVLNDIGPVIDPRGLLRIRRRVGQLPVARSFAEGGDILRWLMGGQFPRLEPHDWIALARRTWREHRGRLVPDYDVKLARSLYRANLERPPTLWHEFDALARVPLMIVRGANSDMLAAATLEGMVARRSLVDVAVVANQGHAPLLAEARLIRHIAAFVASCDAGASAAG